jgi:glucose-6-phosphate 1-dehydrogenase
MSTTVEPSLFVIFGATGDLARRKLMPALNRLAQREYLRGSVILGVGRSKDIDTVKFRAMARETVPAEWCNDCLYYCSIGDGAEQDFRRLTFEIENLLHFEVKKPGQPVSIETQRLRFRYAEAFPALPDAYETLLLDVVRGDQTLFVRSDWVKLSWKLYEPLLKTPPPVYSCEPGTWGPPEFDRLLAGAGHRWFEI